MPRNMSFQMEAVRWRDEMMRIPSILGWLWPCVLGVCEVVFTIEHNLVPKRAGAQVQFNELYSQKWVVFPV
jgi:hypothetical protein